MMLCKCLDTLNVNEVIYFYENTGWSYQLTSHILTKGLTLLFYSDNISFTQWLHNYFNVTKWEL